MRHSTYGALIAAVFRLTSIGVVSIGSSDLLKAVLGMFGNFFNLLLFNTIVKANKQSTYSVDIT